MTLQMGESEQGRTGGRGTLGELEALGSWMPSAPGMEDSPASFCSVLFAEKVTEMSQNTGAAILILLFLQGCNLYPLQSGDDIEKKMRETSQMVENDQQKLAHLKISLLTGTWTAVLHIHRAMLFFFPF